MSEDLDLLTTKVQRILAGFLSDVRLADKGGFMVAYESTMVVVSPRQMDDERTSVVLYALMNQNVPATPELFKWVATNTDEYMFGHIGLHMLEGDDPKCNLVFSHTLLGDYLDPEELRSAIGAVANTANRLDDEVQNRFGGERWADPSTTEN